MATATDVISLAIDIMDDGGWCQGHYAKDPSGEGVLANDQYAMSFCAEGALYRAAQDLGVPELHLPAKRLITEQIGIWGIPSWNDNPNRTYAQVRETFKRAAFEGGGAAVEEASLVAV